MSVDEGSNVTTPAPRSLRVVAFILTMAIAAAAGSFLFRKYRRATLWLAAEVGFGIVRFAFFFWSPRLTWVALGLVLIFRLVAALQMLRTARTAVTTAPLQTLIAAWVAVSIFSLGTSALLKRFVVEAFKMPTMSMAPTLLVGDHFVADKRSRPVERGEVIVFRYPLDPTVTYVKRAVAIGGDTVLISGHTLIVNGQPIDRRRIDGTCAGLSGVDTQTNTGCELWEETLDGHRYPTMIERPAAVFGPVRIPAGHVFVLGDNRDNSSDSRVWGDVAPELVVGRPRFIWFSWGPSGIRWERVNQEVR